MNGYSEGERGHYSHPAESVKRRRVAFVGGGTAGHVYPALTIAEVYQRTAAHIEVFFIGTPEGCEVHLVPAHGYCLKIVQGSPLFGVGVRGKLHAMTTLTIGMGQARRWLQAHGIKLVIGLGGYASAGVLLAAWSLGLRTAVHEANLVPGLTNKLLGRFADRVYLGYEAARWAFPPNRTLITGNPVRPEIATAHAKQRSAPCKADRPVHVLVTGGSRGAPFLNRQVPDLLKTVADHGLALEVRHQVGDDDPVAVREAYIRAHLSASVTPYIEDMAGAYRWADFTIARSGSGTIAELAACGLPSLLVPWPDSASDHQTVNAIAFAETGAGWWVREADWQVETLAIRLVSLLGHAGAWTTMAKCARQFATPDAAHMLVADCEALMVGQW